MSDVLIRITAPHFVAGVVARDGRVVEAAPIVRYMIGWNSRLTGYCARKGWAVERVEMGVFE